MVFRSSFDNPSYEDVLKSMNGEQRRVIDMGELVEFHDENGAYFAPADAVE